MKTPKMLPWLARRAGVSDERAGHLWRDACRRAESLIGERDNSFYWGATQQVVLALLAEERCKNNPLAVLPWLLVCDGVERWSSLTRRWLASTRRLLQRQPVREAACRLR